MRNKFLALAAMMTLAGGAAQAATSVTVAGDANPFLAGQASGYTCCGGDTAPGQSPALVAGLLTAGSSLTFSASGGVSYGGASSTDADGLGWWLLDMSNFATGIA